MTNPTVWMHGAGWTFPGLNGKTGSPVDCPLPPLSVYQGQRFSDLLASVLQPATPWTPPHPAWWGVRVNDKASGGSLPTHHGTLFVKTENAEGKRSRILRTHKSGLGCKQGRNNRQTFPQKETPLPRPFPPIPHGPPFRRRGAAVDMEAGPATPFPSRGPHRAADIKNRQLWQQVDEAMGRRGQRVVWKYALALCCPAFWLSGPFPHFHPQNLHFITPGFEGIQPPPPKANV